MDGSTKGRLSQSDIAFIKNAIRKKYDFLTEFYHDFYEGMKSFPKDGKHFVPSDLETVQDTFKKAFEGKRRLSPSYWKIIASLIFITRDDLPSRAALKSDSKNGKTGTRTDLPHTKTKKWSIAELKTLPIDKLTESVMALWSLPGGKDIKKDAVKAAYENECIRLIANKLVYDCTIVEFADFFNSDFGDPDARLKVVSKIEDDNALLLQLATNIAKSTGSNLLRWAEDFLCWCPLDRMKKIVSRVEMALRLASKQPGFLESYQFFERKDYLILIKSFKKCNCMKLALMYCDIFYKKIEGLDPRTPLTADEIADLEECFTIMEFKIDFDKERSLWDDLPDGITKGLN